jgi:hypothetical protein
MACSLWGGGVTDSQWPLHIYYSSPCMALITRKQAHRVISTIMDSMVSLGAPCTAPQPLVQEKEPSIVEIHTGTFHGYGLIPWENLSLCAIVPSMFSPTKWCYHKLTTRELLLSWDLSQVLLAHWKEKELNTVLAGGITLLAKCCKTIIEALEVSCI